MSKKENQNNAQSASRTKKKTPDSALSVQPGVKGAQPINPKQIARFKKRKRKQLSVQDYVEGIRNGDRTVLSRAITLIESTNKKHRDQAQEIINACLPYTGNSVRIGITGVPGVGKSTFIEALGNYVIEHEGNLAVLTIDPSSSRSGGSILGDKTRMETLSANTKAFIRPSPSAGSLGGVARKTRETVLLCEAAGYSTIFIETVGVGQSETTVHSMVDFFLLLMLAGAGDELQGIKRGIMEMADAIVINKADGHNKNEAMRAAAEYKKAVHLFPPTDSGWTPKVTRCSALYSKGIEDVWEIVNDYLQHTKKNGYFNTKRKEQAKYWMFETINQLLQQDFYQNPEIKKQLKTVEQEVLEGKISSFSAADKLLELYRK